MMMIMTVEFKMECVKVCICDCSYAVVKFKFHSKKFFFLQLIFLHY